MANLNNTKSNNNINNSNSTNNMNTTNLICPNCGAHFALPEHEHHVEGTALAKDSNRGDIYLTLDGNSSVLPVTVDPEKPYGKNRKSKADRAIEALKKHGVDTSKFHALNIGGSSVVGYEANGSISPVSYDSDIFDGIDIEGTISNPYLFRRWIVSQLAHMEFVTYRSRWHNIIPRGVHKELQSKGYEYSWRVMINEFKAQARMERQGDIEELAKRSRWYTKECAKLFMQHYVNNLTLYFANLKKKHCKGREYITAHGIHIFTDRINKIIIKPLMNRIEAFDKCETVTQMYHAIRDFRKLSFSTDNKKFYDHVFVLHCDTKMCTFFVDAYKGCGAYYALDNMIKFMDCVVTTIEGVKLDREQSLKYVESKTQEYAKANAGYKLFGMWKRFVIDNGIDFNAKVAEWAKERDARWAARRAAQK